MWRLSQSRKHTDGKIPYILRDGETTLDAACVNYGRVLHLNAKQTAAHALDSGKRHLIWREGDANWWKATALFIRLFYLSAVALDESMCANPALRLCRAALLATSCFLAALRLLSMLSRLQIQKFATQPLTRIFDTNRITLATTRHSAMIYSWGRQKRNLALHRTLHIFLFEKYDAQLAQLNHFDIANAPS